MAVSVRSHRILIAEDDAVLRNLIQQVLATDGYAITAASDGREAKRLLGEESFSILLLDIGLPFIDGWTILADATGGTRPAIIVISARGDERDKVRALDLGADDYLTKPFGAPELLARIRAVLRRLDEGEGSGIVETGDLRIDLAKRTVHRNGIEVRLSPTEWLLLAELAVRPGEVVDQRTLLAKVWGSQYIGDTNYLRTFVLRLRRKLEKDPVHPVCIETIGRQGYRLSIVHQARC